MTIYKVIYYLSRLLRRMVDREDPNVTIHEEIVFTEMYLRIEAFRFREQFSYQIDVQPEAEDWVIPKFSIQPLVENAVKYGVGTGRGGEHITIATRAEAGGAVLTVEDDGPGFDTSVLESTDHVGVKNVRERLERLCGGTMEIQSTPGKGTIVTVRIPAGAEPEKNKAKK